MGDIVYDTANQDSNLSYRGHDHSGDELRPSDVTLKVQDEEGDETLINLGEQETKKTTSGYLYGADVRMDAATTDDVRGFSSVATQSGDGGRNIGTRSYVWSDGLTHNQTIGLYTRLIQKSGSDGALPPSAGVYIDSRNSDYRLFGAIVDDGESIWKHGIVLNGDYSDTLIRGPEGNIVISPRVICERSEPFRDTSKRRY